MANQCRICATEFNSLKRNAFLCSDACKKAHIRTRWKANWANNPALRERHRAKARARSKRRDIRIQKRRKRCAQLRAATVERKAKKTEAWSLRFGANPTIEKLMWEEYEQERRTVEKMDRIWLKHPLRFRDKTNAIAKRLYYRRRNDPKFKILRALRHRLWKFAKGFKFNSMRRLVGCSQGQLMDHLAKGFQRGMTRENYGKWEIDHIIPCTAFDLTNPQHQSQCFHYSNLQALWKAANVRKRNKEVARQMHLTLTY
jgi:hypothetical protein